MDCIMNADATTGTQRTSFTIDGRTTNIVGHGFDRRRYRARVARDADSREHHERGLRLLNRNNISNY